MSRSRSMKENMHACMQWSKGVKTRGERKGRDDRGYPDPFHHYQPVGSKKELNIRSLEVLFNKHQIERRFLFVCIRITMHFWPIFNNVPRSPSQLILYQDLLYDEKWVEFIAVLNQSVNQRNFVRNPEE